MTVLIFLVILAILVFVHELGHFIVAKASGIKVDEFAIGFPPRIFGWKRGETSYSLNLIPFGGYVKIFGENPDDESISGPEKARSFVNKPKYIQALVLIAGIAFNILFAWLLISVGFMTGMPVPQNYVTDSSVSNAAVTIIAVLPNSPADKAGLKTGDAIIELRKDTEAVTKFSIKDVQDFIGQHKDVPMSLTYRRGSEVNTVTLTPIVGDVPDRATIGITLDILGTLKLPIHRAFWEGMKLTAVVTYGTAVGIVEFFGQAFVGKAPFTQVAGPVGIAGLVGDASRLGLVYLLSFTAFISINLAVINLVPFPALDGGRLLFVLIEKIKGSPIKPVFANVVNSIGFVILITFMLVITYQDIVKLFVHR